MRTATTLALFLGALSTAACTAAEDSPDGENEDAIGEGKADGTTYSACELAAVVTLLNDGATVEQLEEAGVHTRAAENLVAHRDGADARFGTEDDDRFDDIEEVDAVRWVGPSAMRALVAINAARCEAQPDIWTDSRDVTKAVIQFPAGTPAPADYTYPEGGQFDLGGTEFWQQWSGGHSPTYSYEEGTEAGKLCMQAAAYRFEAIMKEPPAELVTLLEETNWDGSFFNWNDDFSMSSGDASGARLWAWRTYLIKWISQTGQDGSCYLPTLDLVTRAARSCLTTGSSSMGEIQGCSAR
jgi:hypothetical protein